ncbi:MAG: hypothetical protein J6S85_05710 [Methanobrevibacter sp.]|nr:hypothetical protein [Methanobrevibacter sp.]
MRYITVHSNDLYTAYVNGKQEGVYLRERNKEDLVTFAENLFSELKMDYVNGAKIPVTISVYPTNDPEGCEIIDYYYDPNDPTEEELYILS